MTVPPQNDTRRRRLVLAGLLAVTCLLGARGIGDESAVMLGGDMARYIMDAVFVRDFIADGGATNYEDLVRYAERYYARYPALSLGHHPPVPYLSAVPFFWLFGITTFAARAAALAWFVAAALGLYAITKKLFNWQVAAWAAAMFVTNLVVLRAGQYLLSEMPMTALVLWSVHALLVFCERRRARQFIWFVGLVVASIYAKQLAVLMFPVYVAILVNALGWRTFVSKRALLAFSAGLVLLVPMAIMTVGLSPANFSIALSNSTRLLTGHRDFAIRSLVGSIISAHLTLPTIVVTAASIVLLVIRRRRQVLIGLVWVISVVVGSIVFAGATEPARYAFGAMPAYALLIAALAAEAHSPRTKAMAAVLLTATLWWQLWEIRGVRPSGAGGYEAAAQYVLEQNHEPAVMYSSYIDTGYFVFFTRKHDPARRQLVLRSDKILRWGSANPEQDRLEVRDWLKRLGIRWIVMESRPRAYDGRYALYVELQGPRFAERRRFPVTSTAAPGLELIVYEYLDAQPADLDTQIKIDLPLGSRDFGIRLRDLVGSAR
ncbi:MAG TPA: glycosyltransferase family 39 protein [Vicinamibacterales bacterium]|nr:glycosyltransferase family 39 protein [Vicinamibacterales bacterium]